MAKADYVCAHRLRVRWVEVDMQKVVFNGHYLTYIDSAIADYWRAKAMISSSVKVWLPISTVPACCRSSQ